MENGFILLSNSGIMENLRKDNYDFVISNYNGEIRN